MATLRELVRMAIDQKVALLEDQRNVLSSHFATILNKYEKRKNGSSLSFLREIHEALKTCPGGNSAPEATRNLTTLFNWIDPNKDPDALIYFGNKEFVEFTAKKLVNSIKNRMERSEYAYMYSKAIYQYDNTFHDDKKAGRGKTDTISQFQQMVFSEAASEGFSKAAFEKLLNENLFNMNDPIELKQLLELRQNVRNFCETFVEKNQISTHDIWETIGGLIHQDTLGEEKRLTLDELQDNDCAQKEIRTLLNKKITSYSSWSWPTPVTVNFVRNVAGRYRAYMEEDILTAIFLHYVGAKWSIFLKGCFKTIHSSKIWKWGTGTDGDLYYQKDSIEGYRREFHQRLFLSVLPDAMEDLDTVHTKYQDEEKSHRGVSPIQVKQQLLHLISNEIQLNNILRPDKPITVVQTDMEWFGPSLVHEAILSLMKYFGVTKEWLGFFKKFLEALMKLESQYAPTQIRKRGAPISHQLTTLFGESFLFVMDLYVNRESNLSVYRIHDDFWFWSHIPERVSNAWKAMQTFTKLTGLKLNEVVGMDDNSAKCANDILYK